jgi:hypothetical protein
MDDGSADRAADCSSARLLAVERRGERKWPNPNPGENRWAVGEANDERVPQRAPETFDLGLTERRK